MTNYERIKNLTIEQLAVVIADEIPHGDCYDCDRCHGIYGSYRLRDGCQDAWLRWLESEAVDSE